MNGATSKSLVDFTAAMLDNRVGSEVAKSDTWVELTVHRPDMIGFETLLRIRRQHGKVADVTMRCEHDNVALRVHTTRDEALERKNEEERAERQDLYFPIELPKTIHPTQAQAIQKIFRKLWTELPSLKNRHKAYTIEYSDTSFTLVMKMAPDSRLSFKDLERIQVSLSTVDSKLKVYGRDNHLWVSVYEPVPTTTTAHPATAATTEPGAKRIRMVAVPDGGALQ